MRCKVIDIETDNQFPCFCEACLRDKTEEQMSQKDIRYCLDCQPIIEDAYRFQAPGKRTRYKPIPASKIKGGLSPHIQIPIDEQKTKMSILNSPSPTMDNFRPRGRPETYKKRSLPGEQIKQLHEDGMGAVAIATQLKREQGIDVSYKTIQRILSGERKCVIMPSLSP